MLLLLFYQGSFSPFSDVPVFRQGGVPRRVKRKGSETFANPVVDLAPLERQIAAAQAREAKAFAVLATLEARAAAQLETLAKATQARRVNAVTRQRAVVAALNAELETLNAAMAVETEESDIIFIFSILSEA